MASNEYFSSKSAKDIEQWECELPPDVSSGMAENANPIDVFYDVVLEELDRGVNEAVAACKRYGIVPDTSISYSIPSEEGYALQIGTRGLCESTDYDNSTCLFVVVDSVSNNVLGPEKCRTVETENYFIDIEHSRITVVTDAVIVGNGEPLPPHAACIFGRKDGKVKIFGGSDYQPVVPKPDDIMSYEEIADGCRAAKRLCDILQTLPFSALDE